MKRCIEEHFVAGFGVIPEGSLWADDSPWLQKPEHFADVHDEARKTRKVAGRPVETAVAPTPAEER